MRCLSCGRWSFRAFCVECTRALFVPEISHRKVGSLEAVSFFPYREIERWILTKHHAAGYRIYRFFAAQIVAPFLHEYRVGDETARVIGIDERVEGGYSHTAVLARYGARRAGLEYRPGALIARNRVHYAGKSLQYRLEHPRDFRYRGEKGGRAILVDDVVTTGSTLAEAHTLLRRYGVEVLFAVTLADAAR